MAISAENIKSLIKKKFPEADIEDTVDRRNGLVDSGLSGKFDERLLSYFARVQYDYDGKYLISGVIRRDGSTKFSNLFIAGTDQGYVGIVGAMLGGIAVANNQILRNL